MSGAFRRAVGVVIALALVSACTEPAQPKPTSSRDSEAGPKLSRDAAAILLQYSAYDYGLAGALSGAKTRTVAPARYGLVAIDAAKQISTFSSAVLSATLDRTGPIRDKLVPLADGLTDLGKDSQSYGDGGDPAAFARVLTDVTAGWQRVRDLAALLPKDDAIQATLGRGSSFVVTAKAEPRATITAGPFGSVAEAQQAVRAMGSPLNATVTQQAPFVVRLGPYPDRPSADGFAATLGTQGLTAIVTDDQSYSFMRSGPVPDAELWREPSRVQDTHGASRKVAVSDDGGWLVTGGDDGYAALFAPDGTLLYRGGGKTLARTNVRTVLGIELPPRQTVGPLSPEERADRASLIHEARQTIADTGPRALSHHARKMTAAHLASSDGCTCITPSGSQRRAPFTEMPMCGISTRRHVSAATPTAQRAGLVLTLATLFPA